MKPIIHAIAAAVVAAAVLAPTARAQAPQTAGEVLKIDKPGARITLKHGEIRNLGMPAMTMVFRVRDPRLLDGVAVGDRVRFTADKVDGNFTVTALVKAP
ncbi:MAG: hypothetical protein AMXMBFR66_19820 [Pseudomonadota bacterium]|nr:copper-binding protein [Rubrivivax sp.]NLZ42637.1 copper-binding protein [Comamonadaceae bacterium]